MVHKVKFRELLCEKKCFNCLLKEAREVAVVTLVGRLFHARAAVTRKDRSPMYVIMYRCIELHFPEPENTTLSVR